MSPSVQYHGQENQRRSSRSGATTAARTAATIKSARAWRGSVRLVFRTVPGTAAARPGPEQCAARQAHHRAGTAMGRLQRHNREISAKRLVRGAAALHISAGEMALIDHSYRSATVTAETGLLFADRGVGLPSFCHAASRDGLGPAGSDGASGR